MKLRTNLFAILLLLYCFNVAAQINIDSLNVQLNNSTSDTARFEILKELAIAYRRVNFDSAEYYVNECHTIAERLGNDRKFAEANRTLVLVRKMQGRHDEALQIIEETRTLDITEKEEAVFLNLEGEVYKSKKQYADALTAHYKALEITQMHGFEREMWVVQMDIGLVYIALGQFDKAREVYFQLEQSPNAYKYPIMLRTVLFDIGFAFLEEEKYADAIAYFNKSVVGVTDESYPALMGVYHNNMSIAYTKLAKPDQGLPHALRALKIYKKMNHVASLVNSYNSTADVYEVKGDYNNVYYYADSAYQLSKNTDLTRVRTNALNYLVRAKVRLMDTVNLIAYIEDVKLAKEQEAEELGSKRLAEVQTKYETAKKEKLLTEQEAKLERESLVRNVLILGAAFLVLLLFFIYRGYQNKSKSNSILATKNKEIARQKNLIEQSLKEKETLLREIHHRVKNNLQVVSSLLNMQTYHADSPSMAEAMNEGQNRIKAMALIHQKLYQTEQLSAIDFQEYARQLDLQLKIALVDKEKPVESEIQGNNIQLDIDTAVPLGLILNELVTNAYKYAFNRKGGTLSISLKRLTGNVLKLRVSDNGGGLPKGFKVSQVSSLGLRLVQMLTEQLDGTLNVINEKGATFEIQFNESMISA